MVLPAFAVQADRSLNRPGWTLVWHDEFDGTSVNESKWNIDDQAAPANNELEWYSRDNVYVQNGNLVLKSEPRWINGYQYASGKVNTAGKFDMKYGRVEVRAKLPTGQGIWPAHWMLAYNKWPPEIDITEMIGSVPNRITMSVHWGPLPPGQFPWDIGQTRHADFWGPDFSQGYHHFALDWYSGWLSWQIDGVERHNSWEGIPQENMWLILNTAVGGDWPGPPDGSTPWPQFHEIDYVRVYNRIYGDYPLLNAGFEDGEGNSFPNWNRWDEGNVIRDPVPSNSRSGDGAIQMFGRFDGGDNNSGIYQSIPSRPGERWNGSVWARNRPLDPLTGGNEGRMKLEFINSAGTIIASHPATIIDSTTSQTYARHEIEASSPPDTAWARLTLELFQTGDASGSANFDDASLVRVDPVPGALANADFEQWDGDEFVGWNHYDSDNIAQDGVTANAQSGTGAVHMWGRFDSTDNWSGIYQDLPAAPDQWWEACVFARNRPSDAAEGANAGNMKLEFIDSGGAIIGNDTVTIINASSPENYAPFHIRAQAPAGTAHARIVLEYRQFDYANGSVNFDDASLRTISGYRAWVSQFFDPDSPFADPFADPDGDGQNNAAERAAGTNPSDPKSVFRVTSFSRNALAGEATVQWNAVEGIQYQIVGTDDLGTWDPAAPGVHLLGPVHQFIGQPAGTLAKTVTLPANVRHVRVEVVGP